MVLAFSWVLRYTISIGIDAHMKKKSANTNKRPRAKTKVIKKHASHHLKMALVPNKKNHFRPHLIRRHGIAVVLVLVMGLQIGYSFLTSGKVLGERADISVAELLQDTNAERAKKRLSPLQANDALTKAAELKVKNMYDEQYWNHDSPSGTTPWHWLQEVGYDYGYAGENLAKDFTNADAVIAAWMASPMHRDNVLGPHYTEVGFAVMKGQLGGQQTTLVVALYGAPTLASEVAGAAVAPHMGNAPTLGSMNFMTRFGVTLQSMTPAVLGSLVLLIVGALVALLAHAYRKQLPPAWRRSWRYHHGLYKAIGFMTLAITFVALYSGGQI